MVFLKCPKCNQLLHLEPPQKTQGIRCPACKLEFLLTPEGQFQTLPSQSPPQPSASPPQPPASPPQPQPLPADGAGGLAGIPKKALLAVLAAVLIALIAGVIYKTVIVPAATEKPSGPGRNVADKTNPRSQPSEPKRLTEDPPDPGKAPAANPIAPLARRAVVVIDVFSKADPPREVARRISPSVALLVMEDAHSRLVSMGSGFVVREGVIATNTRVIEGATRGYAKLVGGETRHEIQGVVASDARRGLVLLSVAGLKADALTIARSEGAGVGDAVCAVGNPRGTGGAFSAGIVSSVRQVGGDSLLQITALTSPGSSGGPVVNSKGEVIGVTAGGFKGGQNLNFAIPEIYLLALIRAIKAPVDLATAAKARRARDETSILDKMGQRNTQGVQGSGLLWKYSHGQTGNYSFSLRNGLGDNVKNVVCLVVFYGRDGWPIEADQVTHSEIIPAGLAARLGSEVDGSVQKLTTQSGQRVPYTRVEFRILHFDIVNIDKPVDK